MSSSISRHDLSAEVSVGISGSPQHLRSGRSQGSGQDVALVDQDLIATVSGMSWEASQHPRSGPGHRPNPLSPEISSLVDLLIAGELEPPSQPSGRSSTFFTLYTTSNENTGQPLTWENSGRAVNVASAGEVDSFFTLTDWEVSSNDLVQNLLCKFFYFIVDCLLIKFGSVTRVRSTIMLLCPTSMVPRVHE
jgi:hypothetical protein